MANGDQDGLYDQSKAVNLADKEGSGDFQSFQPMDSYTKAV